MVNGTVEKQSLCYVNRDKQGRLWLYRMADIVDGEVVPFVCDDEKPRYFENRTRLYSKDSPVFEGHMGVWDWTAAPNMSDAEKDYVESYFNGNLEPIEIIELEGSWNSQKLGEALRVGTLEQLPTARKVFYCFRLQGGEFLGGLLCQDKDLLVEDGHVRLKEDVTYLDYYAIHERNRVTVKSTEILFWKDFYRLLNLGKSSKKVWILSPGEIVKTVILRRFSWPTAKSMSLTKQEWRKTREMITEVENFNLYEEVAKEGDCSEEEAKAYVEQFLTEADQYIFARDVQEEALRAAIVRNPSLQEECEKLFMDRWKSANEEALKSGEEEMVSLMASVEKLREVEEEYTKTLKEKEEEIEKAKAELSGLQEEAQKAILEAKEAREKIEETHALPGPEGVSVQDGSSTSKSAAKTFVLEKKEEASSSASKRQEISPSPTSFPGKGEEGFAGKRREKPESEKTESLLKMEVLESYLEKLAQKDHEEPAYHPGRQLPPEGGLAYERWEEMLDFLASLLYGAGVAQDYALSLGAFLYASYLQGAPVLLAGPNGEAIAQAFSAVLFGKLPGELDLSRPYHPEEVARLSAPKDAMIVVRNPFVPEWSDALVSLLLPPKKFFVLVTPFAEDLLLQPKSWQSYCVPVLTEPFIDMMPSGNYEAGRPLPEFLDFEMEEGLITNPLFKEFRLMPFAKQRLTGILSYASFMAREEGDDSIYLYGLLPHAFMEGKGEKLEKLLEEGSISPNMRELLLDFLEARE